MLDDGNTSSAAVGDNQGELQLACPSRAFKVFISIAHHRANFAKLFLQRMHLAFVLPADAHGERCLMFALQRIGKLCTKFAVWASTGGFSKAYGHGGKANLKHTHFSKGPPGAKTHASAWARN